DVGGVDGAGRERLGGRELELRRRERAAQRQALAEGAAGVEVGRERDGRARLDERAAGRRRPSEEERTRRQEDRDDRTGRERLDPSCARRLEMVDRARAELHSERYRALLGELVAVEAKREARVAARLEIPPGLPGVERASLEEHVR